WQKEDELKSAAGRADTHLIEGAGHFQMEGPAFDPRWFIFHFPRQEQDLCVSGMASIFS
ncbi:hypothetical protein ACJX0J_026396, partial [Zea mays]